MLAKSLKQALDAATVTGEDIASLERDLQAAISIEDYDQANSIRVTVVTFSPARPILHAAVN